MKRRSENYGFLARNKKNATLILGLLVVTEEVICDFTETNTIGQIVGADDPSDWQPRLIPDTGFPASFAVAPAYPNPAGLDSVVWETIQESDALLHTQRSQPFRALRLEWITAQHYWKTFNKPDFTPFSGIFKMIQVRLLQNSHILNRRRDNPCINWGKSD